MNLNTLSKNQDIGIIMPLKSIIYIYICLQQPLKVLHNIEHLKIKIFVEKCSRNFLLNVLQSKTFVFSLCTLSNLTFSVALSMEYAFLFV